MLREEPILHTSKRKQNQKKKYEKRKKKKKEKKKEKEKEKEKPVLHDQLALLSQQDNEQWQLLQNKKHNEVVLFVPQFKKKKERNSKNN